MNASTLLLLPVMVQMLLAFVLVIRLGYVRVQALKHGQVTLAEISLSSDAWPDNVKKVANNFNNQFQLPLLFYVLCLLALERGHVDMALVVLAWFFVGFRLLHSLVHITNNNVRRRFHAWLGSLLSVFIMWGYFVYNLWVTI